MKPLNLHSTLNLYWHNLLSTADWEDLPFDGDEYAALVALLDSRFSKDNLYNFAEKLIATNCRSVCTWGEDCELLHDIVDEAYLATDPDFNPPDETMVMTTWYTAEPIEGPVNYLLYLSNFDNLAFKNFVVFALGADPAKEQSVRDAIRQELEKSVDL